MSSTSLLPPINGGHHLFSLNHHRLCATHITPFKWGLRKYQDGNIVAYGTNGHALQMLPNPNASSKGNNEVIMVDPLEAKRLAAKQMEEIKARENFKRKRKIEAINGAWAMIGLTAGLVIEGQTGKSILVQVSAVKYQRLVRDFRNTDLAPHYSGNGNFMVCKKLIWCLFCEQIITGVGEIII